MKTLVLGAAKSGVAAANFLAARGEAVVLADSNAQPSIPGQLDDRVVRIFGRDDEALLDDAGTVVISPGVPRSIALVRRAEALSIPVIGEIELAFRHLRGTVVAVTGSNGKSTTTALTGEILRAAGREPVVAGNIGNPLISEIDHERPRTYVLELSSFQLESIDTFRADVALLLNVTPDHMDRYDTFDDYAAAKYAIFRNQTGSDTAIVNAAEKREVPGPERRIWRFSGSQPVEAGGWFDGRDLILRAGGEERRIARSGLRLEGNANVENALASWLAARALDVDDSAVEEAFRTFAGLPHRMVLVRERSGVRWINDSKGTNVDATLRSLEGFAPSSVILILGGRDKAGEFGKMRELVRSRARTVLTIGDAGPKIAEALQGAAEIVAAGDLERAVRWAGEQARPGETVLLSPACASFDQYRNFEHRGQHFEELVRGLR